MSRKVKVLLNVGMDHQEQYKLPECREGAVVEVDERQANVLVNVLRCARDFDAKAEAQHEELIRQFDDEVIEEQMAAEVKRRELEEKVQSRLKKNGGALEKAK